MKNLALLLFFSIKLANAVYDLEENEKCATHVNGREGICLRAKNCGAFRTERNKLKICSFDNKVPIVCCPTKMTSSEIGGKKRISEIKCKEYVNVKKNLYRSRQSRSIKNEEYEENYEYYEYDESIISTTEGFQDGSFPAFGAAAGGTRAGFREFPHMAAIGKRQKYGDIIWYCGGSLISEKFVLSAAHCENHRKSDVIRIGDLDLLVDEKGIEPQDFAVKKHFVHPRYKNPFKYHDIALYELKTSARFTEDVHPACLAKNDLTSSGLYHAMGYGITGFGDSQSNLLLKVVLNIVNNTECRKTYKDDYYILPNGITKDQICAHDPLGKMDTCQGDSGGPLQATIFTHDFERYYEIIGITSFGKYCASTAPGVYTKVSSYLDWIETIVWKS